MAWTAFTTRRCTNLRARPSDQSGRALAPLAFCLLAACAPAAPDFGCTIDRIETRRLAGGAAVVIHQRIALSGEAREALVHGVPLVFLVEARLHSRGGRGNELHLARRFELRYLPLSDHYQLTTGAGRPTRTYPRLRHALADLSEVPLSLPAEALSDTAWSARARSRLSKRELPPPMRLPAWLSARWRHDSGWLAQEVALPGPA